MSTVIIIIIITIGISLAAFNNKAIFYKLQFNAYQIYQRKQYYRILTHAFVHADWVHLFVNMFVLLSFGRGIEYIFGANQQIFPHPDLQFILLYVSAIIIAPVTSFAKYKNDPMYNAVGASGGVSAVIFTNIFFAPWHKLYLFAFIPIPGIIFAGLYLIYASYMSKKQLDNVNHDAHFIGAVYGFLFPLFFKPELIFVFFQNVLNP